jgi:cold shock CspA family protein
VSGPDPVAGRVMDFDEGVGLGRIETEGEGAGGAGRYRFHCTQIADGSRAVVPGTPVSFRVVAGRGGQWEAADIRPVPAAQPAPGPAAGAAAEPG